MRHVTADEITAELALLRVRANLAEGKELKSIRDEIEEIEACLHLIKLGFSIAKKDPT